MNMSSVPSSVPFGKTILDGRFAASEDCLRNRNIRGRGRLGSRRLSICILHLAIWSFVFLGEPCRADDTAADPRGWVSTNIESIVELYRQLHQSPELSLKEEKTAARMADEMRSLGIKVTTGIGGHGVVGVLENGPGKVLMLRADMDALPVAEETKLPYASTVRAQDARGATVPVMHACAHDIHMSNLVGVARYLAAHRDRWAGTVVFLFQPAEELGAGAEAMLQDGLMDRIPRPDFAVALHVASDLATGQVNYRSGFALANVDSIDIVIKGRGGHGASPETTIDPIIIAARLVLDLQTIVSREVKPIDPAVVTVGSIHAGTKHNIISDECRLQLTLRSLSPEVRKQLQDAVRRKALAAALGAGAPEPSVVVSEGTPAMYNDPELTARVVETLKRTLGKNNILHADPAMGGEDFGRYGLAGVPICMYRLGAVNQQRLDAFAAKDVPPPSLHSAVFYPDAEECLTTGIVSMATIAIDLLRPGSASVAE
jgi:hippurate hydrolase